MDLANRRLIRIVWVVAAIALISACGDDNTNTTPAEPDNPDELSATLEIITTNITSAIGRRGFEPAEPGQQLTVGDQVRTDDTGFAELNYHDGSWQRIENNATLTIIDLAADDDSQVVRTGVDIGQTWNRVRELTDSEDTYELDTPVATAGVRGTAFATDCPTERECTFTVTEGTITITPDTGEPFELTAISTVTVRADEPPPPPERLTVADVLDDPWIAKNLDLDQQRGAPPLQDTPDDGTDEEADTPDEEATGPCTATGAVGAVVLDGLAAEYRGPEDSRSFGQEFVVEFDDSGSSYTLLLVIGSLVAGEIEPAEAVNLFVEDADGTFASWSGGANAVASTQVTGEPGVSAAAVGELSGPGGELIPINVTVTCLRGIGAAGDPGPGATDQTTASGMTAVG